jgi:transcriptional regulator with XRE-family HTH domain
MRRGLTLAQLAQECTRRGTPLSESQASRIERREAAGRPATRKVIADVLGLDPSTDFHRNPSEPADPEAPDMDLHRLRDKERALPDQVPELRSEPVEESA